MLRVESKVKTKVEPALKESRLSAALNWMGRLFQRRGATEQKAWSPMVQSLVVGTRSSRLPANLRVRGEDCGLMSSCRSGGVFILMHLWMRSMIL